MSSEEFLEEVLSSQNAPNEFESVYREFQKYQEFTASTLMEFLKVCELCSIPYELAYGSLLGVERDRGQVPWDYDIDIFVPFHAKQKLIEALKKNLNHAFYFYCPEVDVNCRHVFMRLAPVGFRTEAIHVDVFYYVGTPEEPGKRTAFVSQIKELSEKRYGKLVNIREESLGQPRRYFSLLKNRKLPSLFTNVQRSWEEYERLCNFYPIDSSSNCVTADPFADWYVFPTSFLQDTEYVDSEFGEVRVPVARCKLLEMIYGDYMSLPSLEQRIGEVLHSVRRIRAFSAAS